MDIHEAREVVKNTLEGRPNSCLSEHYRGLKQVYDLLFALDQIGAAPAPKEPEKQLKLYHITVTLEDEFLAADKDEAWEMAMDKISGRRGMMLCGHKVEEVT